MGTDWTGLLCYISVKSCLVRTRPEGVYHCIVHLYIVATCPTSQNLRTHYHVHLLSGYKFHSDYFMNRLWWDTGIFILI